MRTVSEVYPSEWLHAANLMGRSVSVTIDKAVVEEFRQKDGKMEGRIVVAFRGAQKRLVCNKTQAIAIAAVAGTEEFGKWAGVKVLLSPGRARNGMDTILIGEMEDV